MSPISSVETNTQDSSLSPSENELTNNQSLTTHHQQQIQEATEAERIRISDALTPYTNRLAEKGLGLQDMELQEIVSKIVEVVQPTPHEKDILTHPTKEEKSV